MGRRGVKRGGLTGFFFLLVFAFCLGTAQADLGGNGFRNVDTWQDKNWKVQLGFRAISDSLDVLNLRDTDVGSQHRVDPGDLKGAGLRISRLFGNDFRLEFSLDHDDLDYGFEHLKVFHAGAVGHWRPFSWVQVWGGMRTHMAEDMKYVSSGAVNAMLSRFKVKDTVRWDREKVYFDRKSGSVAITVSVPREGRPDPMIALEDLSDRTLFAGMVLGAPIGILTPSVFVEVGRTDITTRLSTTLDVYADAVDRKLPVKFPLSLDRDENYLEAGVSCALRLGSSWRLLAEYSEIQIDRDKGLDSQEKNQILSSALFWRFSEKMELHLGARYFERQLNGVLPFLYNTYSQSTFRHSYGLIYGGVSFFWDGF